MAELEELIESFRAFAVTAILFAPDDRKSRGKLLKQTLKAAEPPPETIHNPYFCSGEGPAHMTKDGLSHSESVFGSIGKVNQKVEPSPGALFTPTSP